MIKPHEDYLFCIALVNFWDIQRKEKIPVIYHFGSDDFSDEGKERKEIVYDYIDNEIQNSNGTILYHSFELWNFDNQIDCDNFSEHLHSIYINWEE